MGIIDTLKAYDDSALEYAEATKYGDMKELCDRFLMMLPDKAYILDFGCGSGRDSKYFISKGYIVDAIDGSKNLCDLASDFIGQPVKHMTFDELDEEDKYDGIWACSSILHVERKELPAILEKMLTALKSNGVIYTCFKIGDKYEIKDGKYYNYMTRDILEGMLKELKNESVMIDYFESETKSGVNRPNAHWGNYFIKKPLK